MIPGAGGLGWDRSQAPASSPLTWLVPSVWVLQLHHLEQQSLTWGLKGDGNCQKWPHKWVRGPDGANMAPQAVQGTLVPEGAPQARQGVRWYVSPSPLLAHFLKADGAHVCTFQPRRSQGWVWGLQVGDPPGESCRLGREGAASSLASMGQLNRKIKNIFDLE